MLNRINQSMETIEFEEVLAHLPVKSLVRCKLLSKKYYEIISRNPNFHHKFVKTNPFASWNSPTRFLGFFFSRNRYRSDRCPVRFLPVSPQGFKLNSTEGFDDSLCFMGRGTHETTIHVLASSNGLLLCGVQRGHGRRHPHKDYSLRYFLCNPITKQWIALPVPPDSSGGFVSHGLVCNPATSHFSFDCVQYKVVRAVWNLEGGSSTMMGSSTGLQIHMLSSTESKDEWKRFNLPCSTAFRLEFRNFPAMVCTEEEEEREEIVHVFYWPANTTKISLHHPRFINSVVVFDPRKQYLDQIELPDCMPGQYGNGAFGQSQGKIYYIRQYSHDLDIWILDNKKCFRAEWCLKQRLSLQTSIQQYWDIMGSEVDNLYTIGIHPDNPEIIFIHHGSKMALFNAKDSSFELVCDFVAQGWKSSYVFFGYVCPCWPLPLP